MIPRDRVLSTLAHPIGDRVLFDLGESPLAGDISAVDIDGYDWPDSSDPALVKGLREQAEAYHREGYAVILGSVCAGLFEMSCRVRGFEQFYTDLGESGPCACADGQAR